MPSSSTTGSSTSATVVVCGPKPVASASSASAMTEADSTVRKTVARLIASFQRSDRVPSRLQCSVARMAAASGPNGRPGATAAATGASSWAVSIAPNGVPAFLALSVVIVDLLEVAGDGSRRVDSVHAGRPQVYERSTALLPRAVRTASGRRPARRSEAGRWLYVP